MNLFDLLKSNSITPLLKEKKGRFVVDENLGSAFFSALSYRENKEKQLIVCPNLYKAQQLYSLLSGLIDKSKITLFPSDELIRAESLAENNELSAGRVYSLYQILNNKVDVVITNVSGVIRYLPNKNKFNDCIFTLKIGDIINIKELRKKLTSSGYRLVNKIDQSLQFAVRGDIIDVFSINDDYPTRIELFGDEIDSIRHFDIATQTSFEKINQVEILPASDILLDDEEINNAVNKLKNELENLDENLPLEAREMLSETVSDIDTDILEKNFNSKLYKYYSYFCDNLNSLFDYCEGYKTLFINDDAINAQAKNLLYESNDYLIELKENYKALGRLNYYFDLNKIKPSNIVHLNEFKNSINDKEFAVRSLSVSGAKIEDASEIIRSFINQDYKVLLFLNTNEQINLIEEICEKQNFSFEKLNPFDIPSKSSIGLEFASLPGGCQLEEEKIVILTQKELFNIKHNAYRYSSKYKEGTILKSFEDLEPGDYVVHEYQGIGQFQCLQTLEVDGNHKDFLKIIYANDEILYVPLAQFQLVRKYVGKEGATPRLSRLHSSDWEKQKKKIKERINDLANRLMSLYRERALVEGFAFESDDELQEEFEDNCPFELTKDQKLSLKEIKEDMESTHPMDRLLCGDVGFGKTEVAFRAAFKAILSDKQVALLCPTTLLARQHYERALERFAGFDVNIAVFSRLIPAKQQQIYQEGVANGSIHLVIGTHRLLSKDIHFKNLGLLIVDEEQRFGVEQKEKIKELKSNVDVLTLSATPIPRTLQMSLLGMRNMSIINTAPKERMPVQTYVMPYKSGVIKELIERELSRNGQVFYLHNKISTLYEVATRLQKQIPNATIAVAHGQMDKDDIEDIMVKFYNNEISILVCTSIIENGIDVPNANMIIVDNADHYGLSQLYQIKGRVGRSDRIAYAYLLYNEGKVLNENARKRLKAIKEFTSLGSGYKVAQRDLMIRGAGDILGPEQAGFIDSIGLDMYIKLLNETVKEKMSGAPEIKDNKKEIITNLDVDAYIPDNYAKESNKIELYHSIEDAKTMEELSKAKVDIRDMYGKIPESVELLFDKQAIDILAKTSNIENLYIYPTYCEIILGDNYLNIRGIGNILFEAMMPYVNYSNISYINKLFKIKISKRKSWVNDLTAILSTLDEIMKKVKQ